MIIPLLHHSRNWIIKWQTAKVNAKRSYDPFAVASLKLALYESTTYISSKPAIKDNDEFSSQQIEMSRLKKPNGAAFHLLTTQNPDDIHSMLIWCEQFKEYIGSADFKPAK